LSRNVIEPENAELVTEFDRYVREHADFAEWIPDNALAAMLVEGGEEFNRWSQAGANRPISLFHLSNLSSLTPVPPVFTEKEAAGLVQVLLL